MNALLLAAAKVINFIKKNYFFAIFTFFQKKYFSFYKKDSKIYIWHKNIQKPIKILSDHKASVNAVSWSRKNPQILISGDLSFKLLFFLKKKIKNNYFFKKK